MENQDIGQEIAGIRMDYVLDAETEDILLKNALEDRAQGILLNHWDEMRRMGLHPTEMMTGVDKWKDLNLIEEINIEKELLNKYNF